MRRSVSCPIFTCLQSGANPVAHIRDERAMVKCTKSTHTSKIPKGNEAAAMRHLDLGIHKVTDTLMAPHHECVARVVDSLVTSLPWNDSIFVYTYLSTRHYALDDLFTYCSHFEYGPPWGMTHRLAVNLTRALAVCHLHDVAHGDVKPENILVNAADQSVKLIDFAFAVRGVIHMSKNKHHVKPVPRAGTPPYLAPEVLHAEGFSVVNPVLCDVYALGITLTFVAAGGQACAADYKYISRGLPGWMKRRLMADGWPQRFFDAISACTEHRPHKRPSTMQLLSLLGPVDV